MLENLEAEDPHLNTTRRSKDRARHSVPWARQRPSELHMPAKQRVRSSS